ncbi:MAG TPA: DEAD/DEAH box helicase, partial [Gaiellales bacterium]|nr:DEAD/DEAH box helicase [Gaiellales bacterium]
MTDSFQALGVSEEVCAALAKAAITEPFAVQWLCIPAGLEGTDVIAKSPTGSGKTLAFGLPLIMLADPEATAPEALVLCPTRELAQQIGADLEPLAAARGVRVAVCYGGAGLPAQAKRASSSQIVIATPGRLIDLSGRRMVDLRNVRRLVLDEADRMVDMGFLPQVERIVPKLHKDRQTLFFSATVEGAAGVAARRFTRNAARIDASEHVTVERGDVDHSFISVTEAEKYAHLTELLEHAEGLTLVFCETKTNCAWLARRLEGTGVRCEAIHGDRSQAERNRAMSRFAKGEVRVLVATDVAARGIDLDGIGLVVNYDAPSGADDYTHRVGRTARAGADGRAVTLVTRDQQADVSRVATRLEIADEFRS